MFLLNSWVGKDWAGPFFPPPLHWVLTLIYLSVLGLNYSYTESEHSWLTYLKEKFKLQAFSQMILLNRGWGKSGPAHSFPPLIFSNLSIYLSVFRLTNSCTVSEHSWLSCPKEKFKLRKHLANCMFLLNSGVGKDWASPFSPPPPLHWVLTLIYLSVLGLNYSYTESEHSWLTYLKEKFKFQAFSQMILLNRGWGKTGLAYSFPL